MTKLEQEAFTAAARWIARETGLPPGTLARERANSLGALISQFAVARGAASADPELDKENAIAQGSYHCAVEMIGSLRREAGYEKVNVAPLDGVGLLQSVLLRFAYAYAARIEADRARVRELVKQDEEKGGS